MPCGVSRRPEKRRMQPVHPPWMIRRRYSRGFLLISQWRYQVFGNGCSEGCWLWRGVAEQRRPRRQPGITQRLDSNCSKATSRLHSQLTSVHKRLAAPLKCAAIFAIQSRLNRSHWLINGGPLPPAGGSNALTTVLAPTPPSRYSVAVWHSRRATES